MAEEHRCQAPRLCANNCGFFGSPATQDFCSKCYRDLQLKEQGKLALNQTLATSSSSSSIPSPPPPSPAAEVVTTASAAVEVVGLVEEEKKDAAAPAPAGAGVGTQANRCSQCRKRVGLTGFKCRCGMVFCGGHRYPEKHSCGFDFKTLGKEQIAKANPVVKGEKLHKI